MAYVVRRPNGSWEIRESVATPKGPRSHTLATFRRLTPGVVDKAVRRATRPTTHDDVHEAARRAGAVSSAADTAARTLLTEVASGRSPSPGLSRLLVRLLQDSHDADPVIGDAVLWLEASPEERGKALDDLLGFVDALPPRPPRPMRFPPLRKAGAAHA
ncbi:MAG TPA: hypothetical protein VFC09_06810 [Candidatus Dormibacteraeota bacterium]|nr:hypothetical protein [Candidatus Dormibacteraeota bacterium]